MYGLETGETRQGNHDTIQEFSTKHGVDFNVSIQKWPMNLDATYEHPDVVINLHDEETAKRVVRELDGVYTSDSRIKIDHDIWQTRVVDQAMKAIVERREDQRRETTTE